MDDQIAHPELAIASCVKTGTRGSVVWKARESPTFWWQMGNKAYGKMNGEMAQHDYAVETAGTVVDATFAQCKWA